MRSVASSSEKGSPRRLSSLMQDLRKHRTPVAVPYLVVAVPGFLVSAVGGGAPAGGQMRHAED